MTAWIYRGADERGGAVLPLRVVDVSALEVLDSRGRPNLTVSVDLEGGASGTAGVPSGASTGRREARELRDGDPGRYGGDGVLGAVQRTQVEVRDLLCGQLFASPRELDEALLAGDGTPDLSRLGANVVVGVSMAVARAWASASDLPLWQTLAPQGPRLPVPHLNVINGGAHAANDLDFQEFMLAPLGAPGFAAALRAGAEIYARLRSLLTSAGLSTGLGDEGGFAPDLGSAADVLTLLVRAITDAGYEPGPGGVAIALDPAASQFFVDGAYLVGGRRLPASDLVSQYEELVAAFPVWSIEDGLAEDDLDGWQELTARLGDRVQVVGDDLFVTDPATIARGADQRLANAALIKVNQVGTVARTLDALAVCRDRGLGAMVSHRSGETGDPFIADLAVASGCGQLKAGAPARGERVAKYNRLLAIAAAHPELPYGLAASGR